METLSELRRTLEKRGVGCDTLTTPGGARLILSPELGARILGAGVDEENAFWVSPALELGFRRGDWNAGGHRTWLAPELGPSGFLGNAEKDWAVPAQLDPGNFRREPGAAPELTCSNSFAIRTTGGTEYRLSITRSMRLEDLDSGMGTGVRSARIRFRHSLINEGNRRIGRQIGLWSILQVPSLPEGSFLIPLTPADLKRRYRIYFGELPANWVQEQERLLVLKTAPGQRYKIGVSPSLSTGVIAHLRPSRLGMGHILISKRFSVDKPPNQQEGNGDAVQAYNSPEIGDACFSELECHAPAAWLEPREQQDFSVDILLSKGRKEYLSAEVMQ